MKKKLLTTVLAVVLCLGMSVTAMAAPSPVGPSKPVETPANPSPTAPSKGVNGSLDNRPVTQNVTAEGVVVKQKTLQQGDLSDAQKNILGATFTAFADIDNDNTLTAAQKNEKKAAAVQALINAALGVNYSYKSGVYAWVDVVSTPGKEIPVEVAGVNAGDKVVIAHLTADGTWENVKATRVENGKVYAVFNSFSPVLVAVTGSSATSPKTADAGMGMMVVLLAVAATLSAVVYAKRRMNYAK